MQNDFGQRVTTKNFPSGISTADFYWLYRGQILQMQFTSGFVGTKQIKKNHSLRPEIGWGVYDSKKMGIKSGDEKYSKEIIGSN